MPLSFKCPNCGMTTITFMRVGEIAACQVCDIEVTVPEAAVQVDASIRSVKGSGRTGSGTQVSGFEQVVIGGSVLRCMHCGCRGFFKRRVLLNTRGLTYLGLEWMNDAAQVLECANCGYLHWFSGDAGEGMRQEGQGVCLSCGAALTAPGEACGACGWDYREKVVEDG
jgi:predicted nucleic-acid-binding Zn-ribbon protein